MTLTNLATDRILNFSAGPAVLPESVLHQARADLWNIAGSGIGILEHSHRGAVFTRILEEAEADCRAIAGIGDDHAVLFLQGGASLQFSMVPMNFLAASRTADHLDTGVWTTKAIKEARKVGTVHVAFDGSRTHYDHVPTADEIRPSGDPVYLHYCSNNTIYGTRYPAPPRTSGALVADMSSEMFSRPIDFDAHDLVYAGAQKNLGPSGVTLVIAKRSFLERGAANLPSMLDYRQHDAKGSRLNTPPTFGIHVMGLVFKWILEQGGLEAIAARNEAKAAVVYEAIDRSGGFYRPVARADCRSFMNIPFRTPSDELDKRFIAEAAREGMDGLKGHRDVGGLRASIYNAFPPAGCDTLAQFMDAFAAANG